MSKARELLILLYSESIKIDEDFSSSSDWDKAKNSKRSRASRLGWTKHRNKYISGMERNIRLKQMFSGKSTFLTKLRASIKKVKNAIRQKKMRELSKQKYLDRLKFNLFDSQEN